MNRKSFLKKLGIGAVVVAVAPKVIAEKQEKMIYPVLKDGVTIDTDLLPVRASDIDEIIRIWKQTGNLIYKMSPYQESYQRSWFNLQSAIEKSKR